MSDEGAPDASKTAKRVYGRPFQKGTCANPTGRPQGSRNSATILAEKLMQDGIDKIIKTVMDAANQGDMTAARLVLERIVPVRKGRTINLTLPQLNTAEDVSQAVSATVQAMADGELTPDEAATVAGVLEAKRRTIEVTDLESRIKAIEEAQAAGRGSR
jgi:predicted transcriptional regulator